MATYTVEEIFNGNKYSVMSEVVKEILISGSYESAEDEQTAIEMAYVKHTILVLQEMERNAAVCMLWETTGIILNYLNQLIKQNTVFGLCAVINWLNL